MTTTPTRQHPASWREIGLAIVIGAALGALLMAAFVFGIDAGRL
jgi:hypothetical protein